MSSPTSTPPDPPWGDTVHDFDPWPGRVAFYHTGEPVTQRCLVCRLAFAGGDHRPRYDRAERDAPLITEGPWAGWLDLGYTADPLPRPAPPPTSSSKPETT